MVTKVNVGKGTFDLGKYFEQQINKGQQSAIRQWQKTMPPVLIQNVKTTVQRGNSPVKGFGRFKEYSPSYKEAIRRRRYPGKKIRPVNLTLTGRLMRSLISKPTKQGFVIYYTSKLAKIHSQLGAGKSKVIRKIMPSGREQFKKSVTLESDRMIEETLKKEFGNIF